MFVKLRDNWPGGIFGRTVQTSTGPVRLVFTAGEIVELDDLELAGVRKDIDKKVLLEVEETRRGKWKPVDPPKPEPVYEEPSDELVEENLADPAAGEAAEGEATSDAEPEGDVDAESDADAETETTETDAAGDESTGKGKGKGRGGRRK